MTQYEGEPLVPRDDDAAIPEAWEVIMRYAASQRDQATDQLENNHHTGKECGCGTCRRAAEDLTRTTINVANFFSQFTTDYGDELPFRLELTDSQVEEVQQQPVHQADNWWLNREEASLPIDRVDSGTEEHLDIVPWEPPTVTPPDPE